MSKKHLPLDPSKGLAAWTDGSSDSRNKAGGWAWIVIDAFGGELSDCGGALNTTNNRMEMTAWIECLQTLFLLLGECRVIMYSDSEYVGLGAMDRQRNRNKNKDLWEQLDQTIDDHLYIEFNHVKGHKDDVINNLVDQMAGEEMHKIRAQITTTKEIITYND